QLKQLTDEMDFLNLDEEKAEGGKRDLTSGWDQFFWGTSSDKKDLVRGFYNFYPVQEVKKGARLIATFEDPSVPNLKDGTHMPFMVYHERIGSGKSFWIGWGDMHRLRQYKEAYHQRFWIKLCRF